jgi:hypothetical protein
VAHARQTVQPRGAGQPHQQAFGLIFGGMAQNDGLQPPAPRPIRQKVIAGQTGLFLKVAGDIGMVPDQPLMRNGQCRADLADQCCLGRRFRAQAMINSGGLHPARCGRRRQ